jgi:hypothetical protein
MNLALICACVAGILVFSVTLVTLLPKKALARDCRALRRFRDHSAYEIVWLDEGGRSHAVTGRGRDLSTTGAAIETPYRLALNSLVSLLSNQYQLTGSAYVRHCTRKGRSYIIGLEFKGPLVRSF